uniref:G-protein coupled receptors family 1 profile domain-containing protein n=1 Tax=Setaria digitata TaxID=48799 RepID=A0A915PS57_9BILA
MIFYEDQCSFLDGSVKCKILSSFGSAPIRCLRYAFITVMIERVIALFFYQTYEKWNYPIVLFVIPLTWFEIALSIKTALKFPRSSNFYKSYCSSVTASAVPYLKLKLRKAMDSLSSRYQVRENMKTSKTMVIATLMYVMSSLMNIAGTLLLTNLHSIDLIQFAVLKEITSFGIAIFSNAISILFILRVDQMRNRAVQWIRCIRCGTSNRVGEQPDSDINAQQHIEIIQQMWEKEG